MRHLNIPFFNIFNNSKVFFNTIRLHQRRRHHQRSRTSHQISPVFIAFRQGGTQWYTLPTFPQYDPTRLEKLHHEWFVLYVLRVVGILLGLFQPWWYSQRLKFLDIRLLLLHHLQFATSTAQKLPWTPKTDDLEEDFRIQP